MLTIEKIESSGQFLFRWRGYLPLIFLMAVAITIYIDGGILPFRQKSDFLWPLFCLTIGSIGIIIRIFTVSFVPYGNSGRGTEKPYAETLNSTGMYSIMRNPVYFGNFFTFLAPVVYAQNIWLILLYIPVFALYHERIIAAEEKFLLSKFGDDYRAWTNNTPIFFPAFSKWENPNRTFSWKTAYRRESISFFTLVATIWGLEIFSDFLVFKSFVFDCELLILLILSAGFFILNCILVKYTKTLNV